MGPMAAPQKSEPANSGGGPIRFLIRYFLRGLLFVVPAAATVWILLYVFNWIDGLVSLDEEGKWTIPIIDVDISGKSVAWKGFGFIAIIVAVTGVGLLTSNVLSGWLLRRIEQLFTHVPVVKQIYTSIKDMVEAFVSEHKKFDKPVLLLLSESSDVEVIGFVTQENLAEFDRPGKVAVYVPQSYNFAANLILVPKERVTPIDLSAGDVMAFVVSGGVSNVLQEGAESKNASTRQSRGKNQDHD